LPPKITSINILLVEAELARARGDTGKARELYDESIALAKQNLFLNEEALACELAGKFHLERGLHELAGHYLGQAHRAYHEWGAFAIVKHLEEAYPQFFFKSRTWRYALVFSDYIVDKHRRRDCH
jgi:tetratricopeptide (TPR) repeat protein